MTNDETVAGTPPDVLSLLATNERAIGSLYQEYARQIPKHEDFWLDMSADERHHAELIEALGTTPKTGISFQPRFTVESIHTFTAYVREQHDYARQGTTMAAAIASAYYLETALMERRFFEQLPQQSPAVARVMNSLKKETERHVRKTRDALTRFGSQPATDTQ
ncbi:MAG: hypothetical protein JXA58_02780 [Dehalococcoidia bacterium]|nr:hypothetical protein [Dehalococcoidia bacterium]